LSANRFTKYLHFDTIMIGKAGAALLALVRSR